MGPPAGAARFPALKTLDGFDFDAADGIDRAWVADLARGAWLARGETVIRAGPIGTGKTHLAIAVSAETARKRRHIPFHRAADLVRRLLEAP